MEWVETTGRTIEEAKDAALDELGVDESDAEFEVLEEPKTGLFGRIRVEARVRARVRPTTPRPKDDRRDRQRRRRSSGAKDGATSAERPAPAPRPETEKVERPADSARRRSPERPERPERAKSDAPAPVTTASAVEGGDSDSELPKEPTASAGPRRSPRSGSAGQRQGRPAADRHDDSVQDDNGGRGMEVALEEQAQVAEEFLNGLVAAMELEAGISITHPEDETVELALTGDNLGLLIGPKGATLMAIQDLTRTVVQRQTGASNGRLLVDIAGYRQKRKIALERFATQLAGQVKESGTQKVLEPMNAADRKIVHDTIGGIAGVATRSDGEMADRHVVIFPADD